MEFESAQQVYEVPYLAELLHSLPRLDLTFTHVNSTFRPGIWEYQQSLMIWASAPTLLLLVTLLIFLIYFCYQCCKADTSTKRRHIPCLRWSIVILAILACGSIAVGFYGNREGERGLDSMTGAVNGALDTVQRIQVKMRQLTDNVNATVHALDADEPSDGDEERDKAVVRTRHVLEGTGNISRFVNSAAFVTWSTWRNSWAQGLCFYRWMSVTVLLTLLLILCFVLLIGIAKSSRYALLMFCAFGAFILVVCWALVGVHVAVGLASSDFCFEPSSTLVGNGSDSLHSDIVNYYVVCDSTKVRNPFTQPLQDAITDLKSAQDIVQRRNVPHSVTARFDEILEQLMVITALVECHGLHFGYMNGLHGLCHRALPGFALLTLSLTAVALLFTVLIVLASLAGKHIHRRNRKPEFYHVNVTHNEDEASVVCSTPNRSFSRLHREQQPNTPLFSYHRTTPPPAYHCDDGYYRQYSDFSPSEDGRFDCIIREPSTAI